MGDYEVENLINRFGQLSQDEQRKVLEGIGFLFQLSRQPDHVKEMLARFVQCSGEDQYRVIQEMAKSLISKDWRPSQPIFHGLRELYEREAGRVVLGPVNRGC